MQTRTTIERRITGTERRHGSWLTDRQKVESVEEEKRIFVKSFWQMENGKLTRLPIDANVNANANDHHDDGSAKMWAVARTKGTS